MTAREEVITMIQNLDESELPDIAFGILAIKAGATAEEAIEALKQKRRMQEDCAMDVKRN